MQSLHPCRTFESQLAPQLLVSVQSVAEAKIARELSVGWIDLKNPSGGSLGAPTLSISTAVGVALRGIVQKSVALGELSEASGFDDLRPIVATADFDNAYPIAKVGLAHLESMPNWQAKFAELAQLIWPTKLIPVLYADRARCGAPSFATVLQVAVHTAAPYILVDTFFKDGQRLLDYLKLEQIAEMIHQAGQHRVGVVLAGSLHIDDVPLLIALQPTALAVRGAVCNGARTSTICREKVSQWMHVMESSLSRRNGS